MTSSYVAVKRFCYNQVWLIFFVLVLAGCFRAELADPEPDEPELEPDLPSLACNPFIKTGYTEKTSYFPGEKIKVFFESKDEVGPCCLTIYSVTGDSVFSTASALPLTPQLADDASMNGFRYPVAVEFPVPLIKSGIYMIERNIPFIVKTEEPVDVMVVYASNTANAYAETGGKSLYSLSGRPAAVSFHRPVPLQTLSEVCLKWFEKLADFRIGYVADMDMDSYESIGQAKVLVIAGHSEYWTRQGRQNFDKFVDDGGHALILSGNTMWWQVRYSDDFSQLICYKDYESDPVNNELFKTINWNEPSLGYPIVSSIGSHFPLGGYGRKFDNGWDGYKIANPLSPIFEGLDLDKGDIIALPSLEYDGAPLSGFDDEGYPLVDTDALGFEKVELLAFDRGFRVVETTATFVVFKKTSLSGVIINTSTTDWCSSNGMGGRSESTIKAITYNALNNLVNGYPVFSQ
ncbi:MAG TPA: N,N-dimethylformamidase beta subunit family domain-containing protein [Chryseosolibacter sp.]